MYAAILLLAGCHQDPERIFEDVFTQTCKVDAHARISIKNLEGSIHIYGSAVNEVRIEATKQAYQQERLDKIAIKVTAQPDSVSIDTNFPPKPKLGLSDRSGTVDYYITVPQACTISRLDLSTGEVVLEGLRIGQVNASLVNGRLSERNCFGAHQLSVANGGIDLAYDWWEKGAFSVDAKVINGNARAFFPGNAGFHLLATTVDGTIASDFSEPEMKPRGRSQKLDTVVGDASSTIIKILVTSGTIKIIEANPDL
jgi:hypothetical protein